jgi:hypothetical protein
MLKGQNRFYSDYLWQARNGIPGRKPDISGSSLPLLPLKFNPADRGISFWNFNQHGNPVRLHLG